MQLVDAAAAPSVSGNKPRQKKLIPRKRLLKQTNVITNSDEGPN